MDQYIAMQCIVFSLRDHPSGYPPPVKSGLWLDGLRCGQPFHRFRQEVTTPSVLQHRRLNGYAINPRKPSLNLPKLGDTLRSITIRGPIFSAHSCFTCPGKGHPAFLRAAEPPG